MTHYNVSEFVEYISIELTKFENGVATYMNTILNNIVPASPVGIPYSMQCKIYSVFTNGGALLVHEHKSDAF